MWFKEGGGNLVPLTSTHKINAMKCHITSRHDPEYKSANGIPSDKAVDLQQLKAK